MTPVQQSESRNTNNSTETEDAGTRTPITQKGGATLTPMIKVRSRTGRLLKIPSQIERVDRIETAEIDMTYSDLKADKEPSTIRRAHSETQTDNYLNK